MNKALIAVCFSIATLSMVSQTIYNGVPQYDDRDSIVNAHGVGVISADGRYYMFGEAKTDSANVFRGFSCYSSEDLAEWKFERIALPVQTDGLLGHNRIGERPKVLRCPKTGEYVMIAHADDPYYKDPHVVYATSPTVNGEYTYQGPLLYKGEPIRKWDIGAFTDDDGHSYLLVHHGEIYRLSEDYHSLDSCMVKDVKNIGESPAMMKKDGMYYWLSSHTTSWERNDNMYSTSPSISGPWTHQGLFCPEGSLTHNTQCSFVLPTGTGYVYVGDRWSFPCQRSSATLVWLPMCAEDGRISIPQYYDAWNPHTGTWQETKARKTVKLNWESDVPETFSTPVKLKVKDGERISVAGRTSDDGGYARVRILDKNGNECHSQLVDFYSKVPQSGLRYISPRLAKGEYTIIIDVTGLKSNWTDKRHNIYGTHGTSVRIDEVIVH